MAQRASEASALYFGESDAVFAIAASENDGIKR
jgi:hypothetical protein